MFHSQGIMTLLNMDLYTLANAKPNDKNQYAKRLFLHTQSALKKIKDTKDLFPFTETLSDTFQYNISLISHLENTLFLIHDTLKEHPYSVIKDLADAKLVSIFFKQPPTSLENKKKLLDAMKTMRYLTNSHLSASIILRNTSADYVKSKQYMEDPNFSFINSLEKVIDTMLKGQTRHSIVTNKDRIAIRKTLSILKEVAPVATNPVIKRLTPKLKPIPTKTLIGISEMWRRTAFGDDPNATHLSRIPKRSSYMA